MPEHLGAAACIWIVGQPPNRDFGMVFEQARTVNEIVLTRYFHRWRPNTNRGGVYLPQSKFEWRAHQISRHGPRHDRAFRLRVWENHGFIQTHLMDSHFAGSFRIPPLKRSDNSGFITLRHPSRLRRRRTHPFPRHALTLDGYCSYTSPRYGRSQILCTHRTFS
jgi:hypothetical protein